MKINNFWLELADISAKKEAMHRMSPALSGFADESAILICLASPLMLILDSKSTRWWKYEYVSMDEYGYIPFSN